MSLKKFKMPRLGDKHEEKALGELSDRQKEEEKIKSSKKTKTTKEK